jgi:hypothetical protein
MIGGGHVKLHTQTIHTCTCPGEVFSCSCKCCKEMINNGMRKAIDSSLTPYKRNNVKLDC